MTYRIFISSVQREFAKERKALADYIRKDAILGRFFDVFLFEEVPAQERTADDVYLGEVDVCDIYLGIFGRTYGNMDATGVSATEREYNRAFKRHKSRICFVMKSDKPAEAQQSAFIARVNQDVVRKGFQSYDDLRTGVYAALAQYLSDKGLISVLPFDASYSAGIALKDLSVAKMRDFIRTAKEKRQFPLPVNSSPEKLLTALELLDDEGRILNPAALLFGKRPQRFFVTSEVKCAQFYADRVSKPMADHQIYTGDVFELVDQATRFVMTHVSNWVGTRETGDTAEVPTKFELPYDAVKEAIVNAVVHRDYTSNASVQVMLFKDRLEVWSPGLLPRGMTVPKLFKAHKSIPVNPLLARAMYLKGYIEKTGTGTEDMIAKCADWGIPAPEWIEDDDDFRVVLRRPNGVNVEQTGGRGSEPTTTQETTQETTQQTTQETTQQTTQQTTQRTTQQTTQQTTQRMLLKLMPVGNMRNIVSLVMKNPKINIAGMAHVLGLSQNGIKYHIKQIRKKIAFKHVGPWNAGHWEIGQKEIP